MTTATARQPLNSADLDAFEDHDEWLGFGFIGGRKNAREAIDAETTAFESGFSLEQMQVADNMVLFHANRLGWSRDRFFAWANSREGRWVADILIGSKLDASTDNLVRKYMEA